jgi:nucleotide-binding universal stress UspA family protein
MQAIEQAVSFSLKNILLATDFSSGSQTALQVARGIAHQHSSDVYTIHVVGTDSYRLLQPEPLAITFKQFDETSDNAPQLLKALLDGLPAVPPVHHQGRLWEVIDDVVSRNKIDLLVAATHGRTGFSKMIQGSLAEEVFRNISCPTLNVGPEVRGRSSADFKFGHILLATDFSMHSNAPLYAGWLAKESAAKLSVLHVRSGDQVEVDSAVLRLRSRLEEVGLKSVVPEIILKEGAPVPEILKVASQIGADLIVMGARHPEPAKIVSHWPWDIVANVIAEAKWPVLTVREI